jgi:hypothetical protein
MAIDAAATSCCDTLASSGQANASLGSVPASTPAAYRSINADGTSPRAPPIRNPASRNVRAKPSSPSDATPDPLCLPGNRIRAKPGEPYGTTASSR